jgi:lipoate-protein ligase A
MTTDSTGANEVTLVSALSIALKGCRYSELAGQDAIDKISADIPGLVNEGNKDIADGIITWIQDKLA